MLRRPWRFTARRASAPTSVEDCFYTAIEAVNIARKYSTPVISSSPIRASRRASRRLKSRESRKSLPGHYPCPIFRPWPITSLTICPTPDGITRSILRREQKFCSGKYPIVTGLEHDELEVIRPAPRKLQYHGNDREAPQEIAQARVEFPKPKIYGPPEGNVLPGRLGFAPKDRSRKPLTARAPLRRGGFFGLTIKSATSIRCRRTDLRKIFSPVSTMCSSWK